MRTISGFFISCVIVLAAPSTPVGVLTTIGSIRVDGADVRGNGTVRNGSVIETAHNPSLLSLKNGIRFDLAAGSRAQVYDDHAVLELGASQIHASNGYLISVNSLNVVPVGPSSTIRVLRVNSSKLQVSAVTGQAELHNADGVMIARVFSGSSLDFEQQPAGAASAAKVSGKLEKQGGRYLLTDVTTKNVVELQGDNLEKSVGQCIVATGSSDPTAGALIHLVKFDILSCKKLGIPETVAGAAGPKGAAGSATGPAAGGAAGSGGLSTAAIAAIVVGGAAAVGLGSAAATGAFSGGSPSLVSAP